MRLSAAGARLITGGSRHGNLVSPTVVADVDAKQRISCDELFGPAVAVTRFNDIDQAIALANDSKYGLSAGIFTRNLDWAMKFIHEVHSGNLMVNWGPQWRVDLMPVWGTETEWVWQGGSSLCGGGDDRVKNGGVSSLKIWSGGVVQHCKTANSKHQITNKSQIPIFND